MSVAGGLPSAQVLENGSTLSDRCYSQNKADPAKWVGPLLVAAVKLHTERVHVFSALMAITGFFLIL